MEVANSSEPRVIPRAEHTLSRSLVSPNALKVLYRLKEVGYEAYLVGGGVRDMLLGLEPKDFDVATNALPEEIKDHFRNCRLIGRRFRLAHVYFGRDVVEVATFRGQGPEESEERELEDGRLIRDNVYGTLEEDAWRRDFTINALYYNIRDFSVVDYTGGLDDLRAGLLRIIGDPEQRYREDPVRMLRVIRFAAKLGFRIEPKTEAPLYELGHLLESIPPARLYEEILKLFLGGSAVATFELLRHYGQFRYLFPGTDAALEEQAAGFPKLLVARALENTDSRIAEAKPVTPAFLFAALLWYPMRMKAEHLQHLEAAAELPAMQAASADVVREQSGRVAIPKRFSLPMREIWMLQPRLASSRGRKALRIVMHPRFRAAYDFLLLRAESGEPLQELAEWWTQFQEMDDSSREAVVANTVKKKRRRRRRKNGDAEQAPPTGD